MPRFCGASFGSDDMRNSMFFVIPGYVYDIKDEFFDKFSNFGLMRNHDNSNFRPHFYCFKDEKTGLFWMVPLSSNVEKYRTILNEKLRQYRYYDGIVIADVFGTQSVFLVQDMFPITEEYVLCVHKKGEAPVHIKEAQQKVITKKVKKILALWRIKGIKNTLTDIEALEKKLLAENKQ